MVKKAFTGGDKLEARLNELAKKLGKSSSVEVGWPEEAKEASGVSSAFVASVHEFGAPSRGIPPRPFFRPMIAAEGKTWGPKLEAALEVTGMDAKKALELVGEDIAGALAQSIANVNSPALSPVTLLLRDRFGNNPQEIEFSDVMQARHDIADGVVPNASGPGAKPLVWTGDMLKGIKVTVK